VVKNLFVVKPFLKQVAETIVKDYADPEKLTLIFPNRRAAIYFEKYLADSLSKPCWAPRLLTIEEFFAHQSKLTEPDRLTLIFRLYHVYQEVLGLNEPFDRFYFWGDMLLRDFDEVDKYLVNAPQLFKDLSQLKELDETFDYLTEEQKQFLRDFWLNFEEKPAGSKEEFLRIWRKLPKIYSAFVKILKKEGLGYEGMIHREVAEQSSNSNTDHTATIFIGFNALTKAEEVVISKCVEQGAFIYWDLDSYYLENEIQEAGQFLRQYKKHPILGKTFPKENPSHFQSSKSVNLTGVSQRIGQAKLVTGKLEDLILTTDFKDGNTVIVLPDEGMLLPVLNSLPAPLESVNVTMGFPLRSTPLYNLLDLIIEMQVQAKSKSFSHRQVNAILSHAYIIAMIGNEADRLHDNVIRKNRVFVTIAELQSSHPFLNELFLVTEPKDASAYLLKIVEELGAGFVDRQNFDREYAYHFHKHLSRLHEILGSGTQSTDWRGFQKLFRQVVLSQKIPFRGEPMKGLQIMGVLETRNLDFDNVFVLSLNEGMLPASARQGSYIPHSIRKAYLLPTFEHQDAFYAYLFYRVLQRAENIELYYNTEPDVIGNGEMSRYVQQLLLESGLPIKKSVLHNPVHVHEVKQIVVPKSKDIIEQLQKYVVKEVETPDMLTPSSLNDYIECPFKFYLKHLARLKEPNEVEEDLDARIFGNLLHEVMHWFYEELRPKRNGEIEAEDFLNVDDTLERLIGKAFRKLYFIEGEEEIVYEGQRVVVKEIVKEFAKRIIEHDKSYAPFQLTMLEDRFSEQIPISNEKKIKIGGKIDRADLKGEIVRIIDYKTGKDELNFESIASLFSHTGKRNKAAFQTMLYAYVYHLQKPNATEKLFPGLLNRKNLFEQTFSFGHEMGKGRGSKMKIYDARPLLNEFESHLKDTLNELFDENIPFQQTTETKPCGFCAYKGICHR
jgi:hypothetical protein